MSKDDTSTSGGLLSKVVRFVRNPTVAWGELDEIGDKESQYSKQMLKEMLERKRRNDFVRKREFDQLRKLRQREALHGQVPDDQVGRPSFFQSSMTSPDERAVTLKKIDEIEEQMSQQWWKGKPGGQTAGGDSLPPAGAGALSGQGAAAARAYAPTAPAALRPATGEVGGTGAGALFADNSMPIKAFGSSDAAMLPGMSSSDALQDWATAPAASAPAAEPEEFVHEPDLEEASIRFANGDHEGAEAGLLDVLEQHKTQRPEDQFEIWMTLFDLYRSLGLQDKFDSLAIDFAALYNRSAPLWYSTPEVLGLETLGDSPQEQGAMRRDFSWSAPPVLALSSVAALKASLSRAASPWTLSWARLTSIEAPAVSLLADLMEQWATQDGQFVFDSVGVLNTLLEANTPSGDGAVSAEWWRLRMAALHVMGKPDEFELVALDYCVTYEVSPPSWVSPRNAYADNEGGLSGPAPLAADTDFALSDLGLGGHTLPGEPPVTAQLKGFVDADATELLLPLESMLKVGEPLVIACDKLIRVDFTAAGSVLNWAAEQQGKGHDVRFNNLPRLVAVFFNVIGINEHAWVVPRKN